MAPPFLRAHIVAPAATFLCACGTSAPGVIPPGYDAGGYDSAIPNTTPDASSDASPALDAPNEVAPTADGGGGDAGGGDAGAARVVLGYYTGSGNSFASITSFHTTLTAVSLDIYDVQSDGSIVGTDSRKALAQDAKYGIASFASVSNYNDSIGDFDPALAHSAMVTNETTLVANAVKLAKGGFTGINIDFESLAYSSNVADDRKAYTSFIKDLGAALHAAGLQLVISVPAKSNDASNNTWTYPYDFAALGPAVDLIQVMTYDESGPGWSAPGPVSGFDWTKAAMAYAASLVTPSKLLIGLPAYGYDWDVTASKSGNVGTAVAWTGFAALLATSGAVQHWDATSLSPYVDYTAQDGHQHEAWYENTQSIEAKTALVGQYGLAGVSMWALGYDDAAFWAAATKGL
jgi:spore germination protein YaaH